VKLPAAIVTDRRTGIVLGLLLVAQAARAEFPAPATLDPAGVSRQPLRAGTLQLVPSPDGAHVYALEEFYEGGNCVSVLARDSATGRLGLADADAVDVSSVARLIAVAPDGSHLYFAHDDFFSNSYIEVYSRDAGTGALTLLPGLGVGGYAASAIAMSPDGEFMYIADSSGAGEVHVLDRNPTTGALTFVETETDGVAGVDGIAEPFSLAVSPDGAHVYVAGSADDAIAVFDRDGGTGALTWVGEVRNGVGGVAGLNGVARVALSPDGAHLYALSVYFEDQVAVFARNAGTGALTFVEAEQNGVGGVTGMSDPTEIAVSSDGAHVYVMTFGPSGGSNGIVAFSRNAGTGALTFVATELGGGGVSSRRAIALAPGGGQLYLGGGNGVATFDRAAGSGLLTSVQAIVSGHSQGVAISPDGAHVYASGVQGVIEVYPGSAFVAVFARNAADGSVGFVETVVDGAAGITGLEGASGLTVSPDGAHVYVTARDDGTVSAFARALPAGTLSFVEAEQDGVGGVEGLGGARAVALSPDGAHVYVASDGDGAVAVFARNAGTGALSFVEAEQDGVAGVDGLFGTEAVAVSPDGAHVYAAGTDEDAIAIFARNSVSGALTFVGVARDGVGGLSGLGFPTSLTLGADGLYLYVAVSTAAPGGALTVLSRNAATGLLSFVETQEEPIGGATGLGAGVLAPDGTHFYTGGGAVLMRDPVSGALRFVEDTDRSGPLAVSPDSRDVYFGSVTGSNIFSTGSTPAANGTLHYSTRGFGGCDPAPRAGCRSAGRGRLRLVTSGQGLLVWSWAKGDATDLAAFGEPRDGRTHYGLCVYEGPGSPVLAHRALAPAGGGCRRQPFNGDPSCWRDTSTGFKYRDDFTSPEGLYTLILKRGAQGKAGVKVRAFGANLRDPALPLTLPVRVQLQAANGECWETTHATANVNDGTRFVAPVD
jgi:DNA-binding beta-propeller fold protein YncE